MEQVKDSKTRYTPGPWTFSSNPEPHVRTSTGLSTVALVNTSDVRESVANAHLIAAAPDLYAVSERLVEWVTKYPSGRIYGDHQIRIIAAEIDAIGEAARAALKKATP